MCECLQHLILGKQLCIHSNDFSTIYTDFWPFYMSTRSSFKDMDSQLRQLNIDAPRSNIQINGIRTETDFDLNEKLVCLCTQATLAPIVEALNTDTHIVSEQQPPEKLNIEVWGNDVVLIKKKLCMRDSLDPVTILFDFSINLYIDIFQEKIRCYIHSQESYN